MNSSTAVIGLLAILFGALYVNEKLRPDSVVERIVEKIVHVPKEVLKEVPVEKIVEKEVRVPVEVVKEIAAPIPPEFLQALAIQTKLLGANPLDRRAILQGVTDVSVYVAFEGADKTNGEYSKSSIKTKAELLLRKSGVRVKEDSRWNLNIGIVLLPLRLKGGTQSGWAYSLVASMDDLSAYVIRNNDWGTVNASTYRFAHQINSFATDDLRSNLEKNVEDVVASFCNEWLKANDR